MEPKGTDLAPPLKAGEWNHERVSRNLGSVLFLLVILVSVGVSSFIFYLPAEQSRSKNDDPRTLPGLRVTRPD